MNNKKEKMIINLQSRTPNRYIAKEHLINNFVEDGAKKLGRTFRTKKHVVRFFHRGKEFGFIDGLRPGTTGTAAYTICKDKYKTENYLNVMDIPTLKSIYFKNNQLTEAKEFLLNNNNDSFVLKPLSLGSGKGIVFNVVYDNLEHSINQSLKVQNELGIDSPSFILQKYIDAFDIRICIVEGKFSCALWRVQPHVIGNGKESIEELIIQKNNIREKSAYFKRFLYTVDDKMLEFLETQNFKLSSVPDDQQVVYLSNLGNLAAGAESVDITESVSKSLIDLAIRTVASVPGLHTAGVDILTEDIDSEIGFVSEINTNANLKVHYLPYYGKVRMPYKDMIEYMFIKYKADEGHILSQQERRVYREIAKFNEYREYYHNKLGNMWIKK